MSILKLKNGNTWESVTVIKGDKGDTGDDGFSPVVEVEEITGGHTVTITDAEGDHSFNVMDGSGGANVQSDWDETDTSSDAYILNKPSIPTVPSNVSAFTNDAGYITDYTETDPTVPAWAKASTKPTYTASEVGALPSSTFIPSKTSDLTNDSGFITGYTEMTVAEAETGTETASRVLSPAVLNAVVNSLAQAVATTIAQDLLEEEFHLVDDALTIAADTSTAARSYTVTKAGYYPLGVMGWRVVNGSGTGGVYVVPRGGSLSSRSVGSATLSTSFRTVGGAANNCSLYFSILWMKVME